MNVANARIAASERTVTSQLVVNIVCQRRGGAPRFMSNGQKRVMNGRRAHACERNDRALERRLAPPRLTATTVATWFLATFSGSLSAGADGTLWSSMSHAAFFAFLALMAAVAAILLLTLSRFESPRA
jgi:hypothetical protein